jgi:hypothetical protein
MIEKQVVVRSENFQKCQISLTGEIDISFDNDERPSINDDVSSMSEESICSRLAAERKRMDESILPPAPTRTFGGKLPLILPPTSTKVLR